MKNTPHAARMGAGWQALDDLLIGCDDAECTRIRTHLAEGELRPALVVRLDPLVVAVSATEAPLLLLVDSPADSALIRRHRLRIGSRLNAIIHDTLPLLGELFGNGPAAVVDDLTWQSLQQACDDAVRTTGWMVRHANPLISEHAPQLLDRMVPPRQVVMVAVDETPAKRNWRYLGLGIVLVVLLKLLLMAVRQ